MTETLGLRHNLDREYNWGAVRSIRCSSLWHGSTAVNRNPLEHHQKLRKDLVSLLHVSLKCSSPQETSGTLPKTQEGLGEPSLRCFEVQQSSGTFWNITKKLRKGLTSIHHVALRYSSPQEPSGSSVVSGEGVI